MLRELKIKNLTGRAGVRLRYEESDGAVRHGVEPGTRRRLLEANRVAEDWFRSQLSRTNPLAAGGITSTHTKRLNRSSVRSAPLTQSRNF